VRLAVQNIAMERLVNSTIMDDALRVLDERTTKRHERVEAFMNATIAYCATKDTKKDMTSNNWIYNFLS
jgi:hypothetical protein